MSNLMFLGTGAHGKFENEFNNPNFRGTTSIMLDDKILIDFGRGGYWCAERLNKHSLFKNVDTVFYTHSHEDHFDADYLKKLCDESKNIVTIYADKVFELLLPKCDNLRFCPVSEFDLIKVHGYEVTPLKANHATAYKQENPLHYYFKGKKNIFFGFDGGWLIARTWEFLMNNPIDVYVIDSTCGEDYDYNLRNFSHNNSVMRDIIYNTCLAYNVMDKNSKMILTHIAPSLHDNENLTKNTIEKGYIAAYDGFLYNF